MVTFPLGKAGGPISQITSLVLTQKFHSWGEDEAATKYCFVAYGANDPILGLLLWLSLF